MIDREPAPRVSVVVPAFGAAATLGSTLHALRAQHFTDFETIVVDSSADDRTERLVADGFPEVRLVHSVERLAPHAGRNRGAALAHGELLAFTDADCRPAPAWLQRLVAAHDAGKPIVGGAVDSARAGLLDHGVHLCKFGPWTSASPPGVRPLLPTANLLWSRAVWEAVGPFQVLGWSGDTDLSWRARAAGHALAFEPAAVVHHEHRANIASFWRERRQRGRAYAALRIRVRRWSRRRAAGYLAAVPLVAVTLLVRGVRDGVRSVGPATALLTLPVQAVGFAAWSIGEAGAYVDRLRATPA